MATTSTQYPDYPVIPARRAFSWPGIFAGTFVFLGIESTFGVLGAAILGSSGTGIQIWMAVLSIIALYFAGKTSSKLLFRAADRNLGMYHGLVTFGMSIFTTVLVIAIALGGATAAVAAQVGSVAGYVSAGGEWWLFVALVLSMGSAAIGGMHGVGTATTLGAVAERANTRNIA